MGLEYKKKWLLQAVLWSALFSALFSTLPLVAAGNIVLNEVMYAPSAASGGSENEWVEVWNVGNISVSLRNCRLEERNLPNRTLDAGQYLVLAGDIASFSSVYDVDGDGEEIMVVPFSLRLNNENDSLTLTCTPGTESDLFSYTSTLGALRNNRTLERSEEGEWGESLVELGTPGRENSLFSLSLAHLGLQISEILPNPQGADDEQKPFGEWVELVNRGKKNISLQGLKLTDSLLEHELWISSSTLLTTEELLLKPNAYAVIYRQGDSDFTLNNDGYEEVRLWAGDRLLDEVSYSSSIAGTSWSSFSGGWYESSPTPGQQNVVLPGCDWEVELEINNSLDNQISFTLVIRRNLGVPLNISIQGVIEDSHGQIVKSYTPVTKERIVEERRETYSPRLPEGVYQVRFWFSTLECEDHAPTDNAVSRLLAINSHIREFGSWIEITKLSLGKDERARWGEQVPLQIEVYKGNTSQSTLEISLEQRGKSLGKPVVLKLPELFRLFSFTVPLQLPAPCLVPDLEDGEVDVLVEGLGEREETSFQVEGTIPQACPNSSRQEANSSARESSRRDGWEDSVDIPAVVVSGATVPIQLTITNSGNSGKEEQEEYAVWAYVYRGNRCYSCANRTLERDAQKKIVKVKNGEQLQVLLALPLDFMEDGVYKVKVFTQKEGRKTPKEAIREMVVTSSSSLVASSLSSSSIEQSAQQSLQQLSRSAGREISSEEASLEAISVLSEDVVSRSGISDFPPSLSGMVVYQDSSSRAQALLPYFLLAGFALLSLVVFLVRK